jgi:hypothetical protein
MAELIAGLCSVDGSTRRYRRIKSWTDKKTWWLIMSMCIVDLPRNEKPKKSEMEGLSAGGG